MLAAMKDTVIPLPGTSNGFPEALLTRTFARDRSASPLASKVTIAGFDTQLTVLHTKTRPKQLRLMGSDARTYPFVLKVSRLSQSSHPTSTYHRPCMHCNTSSTGRLYCVAHPGQANTYGSKHTF